VRDIELCCRLGAIDTARPLSSQIRPLLARLNPGHYSLEYYREWPWFERVWRGGFHVVLFECASSLASQTPGTGRLEPTSAYCGYGELSLVCTQSNSALQPHVVAEYCALIQAGYSPCVLVIGNKRSLYHVLDGHHKLAAYIQLRRVPAVLVIEPSNDAMVPLPGFLVEACLRR
jgi:hypothetical protein